MTLIPYHRRALQRATTTVIRRSVHSSFTEAVYRFERALPEESYDASNYGYRIVVPVRQSSTLAYHDDYAAYSHSAVPQNLDILSSPEVLDILSSQREWDENLQSDCSMLSSDESYDSDFEEMKESWKNYRSPAQEHKSYTHDDFIISLDEKNC